MGIKEAFNSWVDRWSEDITDLSDDEALYLSLMVIRTANESTPSFWREFGGCRGCDTNTVRLAINHLTGRLYGRGFVFYFTRNDCIKVLTLWQAYDALIRAEAKDDAL